MSTLGPGAAVRSRLGSPSALAAAIWSAVWLLLTVTGQAYPLRVLYAGYQFLPYDELVRNPFGSVWYLHIQPPAWNLVVGVIGAWSPLPLVLSHRLVGLGLGVVLAGSIAATLANLGASRRWSVGLTVLATVNSQIFVHAFEPRYDLAVAAGLAAVVWSVSRLAREQVRLPLLVPVALATAVVLTRSLYHPVWLVAVALVVGWSVRGRVGRPELIASVVVPLLLVGGWMTKNAAEFDRFTMSTWTGMNLLRSTLPAVDPVDLDRLVADGTVSGVAGAGFFAPYEAYAAEVPCTGGGPVTPVLAVDSKPFPEQYRTGPFDGGVTPNFNFVCYLDVYDLAGADTRALIRAEPGAWVEARMWAANNWFEAPAQRPYGSSALWRTFDEVSRATWVAVPHPGLPPAWGPPSFWVHRTRISLVTAVATVACLAAAVATRRRWRRPRPADAVALVVAVVVVWTVLAGVGVELGEQSRFRNAIDPVVVALGSWWALERLRRIRAK